MSTFRSYSMAFQISKGMNTQFGFISRWLEDKHNPRVISTNLEKWGNACRERLIVVEEEFQEGRDRMIKAGTDNNDAYHFGEYSTRKEKEAEQKALERVMLELDEDEIDMDDRQDPDGDPKLDIVVHWVTPSTPFNAFKSNIIAYGIRG